MGKEAPQPGVIAQHGIEPEMRHFVALGIDQPGGVGLRADRLPDRATQIVAERLAQGRAEHEAENVGLDARVAVSRPRRSDPAIELRDARDRPLGGAEDRPRHHVAPKPVEVAAAVPLLAEVDAGGHVQEVADRRRPVFAAAKARHVSLGRIRDRLDRALGHGDADQHADDRLHHRLRDQTVAVGAPVLIALEQDAVVAGDQQAGDGISRQIVVRRRSPAVEGVIDIRRFAGEG